MVKKLWEWMFVFVPAAIWQFVSVWGTRNQKIANNYVKQWKKVFLVDLSHLEPLCLCAWLIINDMMWQYYYYYMLYYICYHSEHYVYFEDEEKNISIIKNFLNNCPLQEMKKNNSLSLNWYYYKLCTYSMCKMTTRKGRKKT